MKNTTMKNITLLALFALAMGQTQTMTTNSNTLATIAETLSVTPRDLEILLEKGGFKIPSANSLSDDVLSFIGKAYKACLESGEQLSSYNPNSSVVAQQVFEDLGLLPLNQLLELAKGVEYEQSWLSGVSVTKPGMRTQLLNGIRSVPGSLGNGLRSVGNGLGNSYTAAKAKLGGLSLPQKPQCVTDFEHNLLERSIPRVAALVAYLDTHPRVLTAVKAAGLLTMLGATYGTYRVAKSAYGKAQAGYNSVKAYRALQAPYKKGKEEAQQKVEPAVALVAPAVAQSSYFSKLMSRIRPTAVTPVIATAGVGVNPEESAKQEEQAWQRFAVQSAIIAGHLEK